MANNWLWNKGRHTFNFGFQFRRTYQDTVDCDFCSGTFNFSQRTTSTPDSNDPNFGSYGSSFASFLLGQVDASERISSSELNLRNKAFAFYAQDNFKLNARWTFNAGLRYDILVPFTETHNDIIFVESYRTQPGCRRLAGRSHQIRQLYRMLRNHSRGHSLEELPTQNRLVLPAQQKTVVQSGFYMTALNGGAYEYGTAFSASFMGSLLNGSFLRSSTGSSVPGYGSWDTQTLPLPQQTPFSPTIANAGVIFDFNYNKRNIHPNLPSSPSVGTSPYDQAWSARVQRELPWDMFLTRRVCWQPRDSSADYLGAFQPAQPVGPAIRKPSGRKYPFSGCRCRRFHASLSGVRAAVWRFSHPGTGVDSVPAIRRLLSCQ